VLSLASKTNYNESTSVKRYYRVIKIDEAGNLIGEINLDDLDTNLGQTTEQTQKVWYDFVNQQISGEVVKIDIVNAKILWNKTVSEF
jgi:hypothetical protein